MFARKYQSLIKNEEKNSLMQIRALNFWKILTKGFKDDFF